jgi:AcrR family transcriptional regulator
MVVFLLHEANDANRLSSHGDISSIILYAIQTRPTDPRTASRRPPPALSPAGVPGDEHRRHLAEAGISSKETLYRHYANKEALFVDVLSHLTLEQPGFSEKCAALPMPQDLPQLGQALTQLSREILSMMSQPGYLPLVRMIIAEAPRFPQQGTLFFSTVTQRGLAIMTALLRAAREQQFIADMHARRCGAHVALQMRILPFSFFAYNFFIHPILCDSLDTNMVDKYSQLVDYSWFSVHRCSNGGYVWISQTHTRNLSRFSISMGCSIG